MIQVQFVLDFASGENMIALNILEREDANDLEREMARHIEELHAAIFEQIEAETGEEIITTRIVAP